MPACLSRETPVLQRNTTGSPWTFAGEPVHRVLPGETTDHPVLLHGWTAVEDDAPEPEPVKKTSKRATADTEGGEPR